MLYAQVATCKYITLVTQEIKVVERQSIIVNLEDMQLRNCRLSPGDKMLRLFPQRFCCGLSNEHLDDITFKKRLGLKRDVTSSSSIMVTSISFFTKMFNFEKKLPDQILSEFDRSLF